MTEKEKLLERVMTLSEDDADEALRRRAGPTLRLCRFNQPDILILDLPLPDMPGIDVLQEIREADGIDSRLDPKLAVVVLLNRH